MAENDFPTGQIFQFEGDPTILNKYWIGEAQVETKSDLYQPYLQVHHKTKSGWRTVAPNGSFNMVINSSEYQNAIKDYNISISKGYLFEKSTNIFSNYVNDLFKMRQQYSKSDPMNFIAKLLLNSIYGRFGMDPVLNEHEFGNLERIQVLSKNVKDLDYEKIDEDLYFISYCGEADEESFGISVSIASAVTAYARVYMSQFKNNPYYNLYYTDTDSIFIDKELDSTLVNNKLGGMKLEYKFTDSVFLSPKVYAGKTAEGKQIIKIKGFKDSSQLSMNDFKDLLQKDLLKL